MLTTAPLRLTTALSLPVSTSPIVDSAGILNETLALFSKPTASTLRLSTVFGVTGAMIMSKSETLTVLASPDDIMLSPT